MEVVLGLLIALAIGLTGVGAGTLTAPILMLWFGVPPTIAVGTALAFGAIVKVPAVAAYIARGQVDYRAFTRMAVGGLPGVVIGGIVLQTLDRDRLDGLVLLLVGSVVVVSALFSLFTAHARSSAAVPRERRRWLGWLSFPIGLEVGFSSAGAGALGTLVLFNFTGLAAAQVVGTDLLFGISLAAVGGSLQASLGAWDPALLVKLLLGGVVGAVIGAQLAIKIPVRVMRPVLLGWLCYVGGHMALRGLDVLALVTF